MEYKPLNLVLKEIRLLSLLPDGNPSGGLCCKLEHVSLTQFPYYTALSYVWGDEKNR
jgi:hypothetical protein